MRRKKWISFILTLALIVTSFAALPTAAYAETTDMHQFMRGVSFTKATAAGMPASPLFAPGSAGSLILPELGENPGYITGFYVQRNDYDYWAIVEGYPAYDAEVCFGVPYIYGSGNWILQSSTDGGITWSVCNNGQTYPVGTATTSIWTEPTENALYRLKIDGLENYTNVVSVEMPTVATEFTQWGYDSSMFITGTMSPYVGCGASADSVEVSSVAAITLEAGDIIYEWYRVDPNTFDMTQIGGADSATYATTSADIGYKILGKIKGDGDTVGGYLQFFPFGEPIAAPVKGYVSNATDTGFVLNLEKAVTLEAGDLELTDSLGNTIDISSITPVSEGAVYIVDMGDASGSYGQYASDGELTLYSNRPGVIIGASMTEDQPVASENLAPLVTAESPAVEVTSEITGDSTDQVYVSGSAFSCTITVPESVASPGAVVRVALGSLGEGGSIAPFSRLINDLPEPTDPFVEGFLTLENSSAGKYYYTVATVGAGGTISLSGTLTSGICPSALGVILADNTTGYAISGVRVVSSNDRQIMFGVENALPAEIKSNPLFENINDFYNIPAITFSAILIDQPDGFNDVTGNMTFSDLNLMRDWNEVMMMGEAIIFDPVYTGSTLSGIKVGIDSAKTANLATNSAIISVSNLDTLQALLNNNEPFVTENFSVSTTGTGTASAITYNAGTLSFGVNHFSTYDIAFAGGGADEETPTGAALTIDVTGTDIDNVYFPGDPLSYTISGFPDIYNGTQVRIMTSTVTGGGAMVDQQLLDNSTDGTTYWFNVGTVTNNAVSISGNVVPGWQPSKIYIRAFTLGGDPVFAPIQLMDGQFNVTDGMPVDPESLIGVHPVKVGLENGIAPLITCDPALSSFSDLYHIPSIALQRNLGSGITCSAIFQNVDFATNEDELLLYIEGIKMTATGGAIDTVLQEMTVGVITEGETAITALQNKPAMIVINGFSNVYPTVTLDKITITPEAGKGGSVVTAAAISGGDLSFGVNHFSDYTITLGNPDQLSNVALLESLSAHYQGLEQDVQVPIQGFDPATTGYAVTITGWELLQGDKIYLDPAVASGSGATVTATTAAILNSDLIGSATVTVTAEDGVTQKTYTVNFAVQRPPANPVTISGITAASKPYDGTLDAQISGLPVLTGVEQGDDVAVTGSAFAAFASKNAGTGKTVNVTGYSLVGEDAGKYTLMPVSLIADITKLALTASAINQTKGVGADNPTPSINYTGFISGENESNSGITPPTAAHTAVKSSPAGNYDIIVTGGNGGLNYSLINVKGTLTVVRTDVPLTGISLQKHSTTLLLGGTETLAVDFTPTNASVKTLTWGTSNAAIATVDGNGKVTAVGAGTVTISAVAADGGFIDSCLVTVQTPVSLTGSLKYNDNTAIPSASAIYQVDGKKFPVYDSNFLSETNKPLQLTLTGAGTELDDQTQYSLIMSLNNNPELSQTIVTSGAVLRSGFTTDVRRVSQMADGSHVLVIVLKDGNTTKSAITLSLSISGSIVPVTGITLPLSQLTINAGNTYTLTANVAPYNASDKTLTWSTSNPAIATVSSSGAVTAVGAGSTTITATTNHRAYQAAVTVNVGARISGKILKDGNAQPYNYLYLYQGDSFINYAYSDTSGNYSFNGVKTGSYTIKAFSPGMGYSDISTAVAISVGDAVKTVGDLNYESAYSNKSDLTVNLQDQLGDPYSGASEIYLYLYCYETGYSLYRTVTAAEKASGAAVFTDVPYAAGGTTYELSISTNDYWDYRSVTVDNAAETETFQIPVRYSVSGQLLRDTDFNGSGDVAVPYAYVVAETSGWNSYYGYTDGQGNYTITGLEAGDYTLKPYETNKFSFTPSAITITNANLTGQNVIVTKGADLIGHVYKNNVDAYKAYIILKDNSDQYLTGATAGSSGFMLEGAVKSPGTYKLQLYYVMEKNGTYPMFVCPDVTFTVDADDIASGRISQNIIYADPTSASDIFAGDGNSVLTDISVVRGGSTANLIIKYKNNGNSAVTASFGAILPTGVTAASSSFTVTNLTAGASGQKSFPLTIGNVTDTYINIPVKVEISGQTYDFGAASLEMAGVTLSGPGAVKTNESFRVYGEATANSTVVIKDALTGKFYASVKPNGRWYSSAVTIATEGTTKLVAEVTTSGGGVSALSSVLSVSATAEQLAISNVKSASAGMSELPVNKIIGARAFTAWVDSQLNGRDISISTLFDKNIISSLTYHFSGNDYTATKDSEGYYTANLNNWSGGGLKTITATVNTTDQRILTFIIAEVTVLIDPSGYVTDDETGERLSGVTVICETTNDGGTTWSTWNAELYGQVNPQTTDSEGNYGWMVPAGTYRVRALKSGFDTYLTDGDFGNIVIPPVRTDVNFALEPSRPITAITLSSDELSLNSGSTSQLTATAVPTDATNASKIQWRSANSTIATVSTTGLVTGKAAGNTTITAYFTRSGAPEITADCVVTVSAVTSGGSTGGGGGGGTVLPPVPGTATAGKTTTIKTTLEGTLSGTFATAPVPKDTITSMLDSAKQAETTGQKAVMEIAVSAPGSATRVQIEIPRDSFRQIANETSADVSVKAPLATLTFDDKAVRSVNSAGAGDISISIEKVDAAQLSADARALVGDRPVLDFSVKAGSTEISSFNGGNVEVSIPYTLKAGEDPDAVVVYYIDSTGMVKPVRGSFNSNTGTVDFTTGHFSQYAVGYNKLTFGDVSSSAWYNDAVTFLAARGITTGTSEGVFSPSAKLTRAQFLVMALRAYGIEADSDSASNFSDAGNTYYTGYLAAARRLGISNGDGKGHFLPNAQITRQDMFVLLYRTLGVIGELPAAENSMTVAQFSDASKVSTYAADSLNALIAAGVVTGSGGKLDPKGLSTRAQMAQVLYNLLAE